MYSRNTETKIKELYLVDGLKVKFMGMYMVVRILHNKIVRYINLFGLVRV